MSIESCSSCGKPTGDCTCVTEGHEEGIFFDGVYYPYKNQGDPSSSERFDATCNGTPEELSNTQ
ncbi:hypothetical protein MCOR27_008569 [Pyricularia oryzae]|uniref:Uncharacterized protein n=5 Tax=Pyricularia TaxID=48558 RepID=A0ABQ8NAI2_PYRGI|nr:uncharacterized protein MGG_17091 [Pyricularia oryzae 70-15]ELQ40307.1 hypothetical protein OOU_Y34scaffold00448g6 [Pyricularia oryzae Y34]KAH8844093.1 hypothetical protein MCOR01_004872 [Pyricularia oryzae]KAI6293985.1 hypothetical protein MCOR33_008788 [Pyricularia grisea]EHA50161.1 hypothetical protein MGG_17091 [Pyricularia oryzae 70-15]KAH9431614.1 hypothetical protein MCOR02_008905 [Pyricularia oryzae]